ncbi:MAG: DUF2442 domain-containing protein [Chloroflexota bacterium]
MTSSAPSRRLRHPLAISVALDGETLRVKVEDGREIAVPTGWFDWLAEAKDVERRDFRIIGGGEGIWWETLDDGISVPRLFGLPEDI